MEKKLQRSHDNKIGSGVLAGFGEYFAIDPTILRLVYAFVTIITGVFPGIVVYLLAIALIPEKPRIIHHIDPFSKEPDVAPLVVNANEQV